MTSIDLATLTLAKGAHRDRESGTCLLEAVAYFAGEPHTDAPACVSPVLRSFGVGLNDVLSDDRRQCLVPFVPRMVGTAGDGLDEARSYLALDWLVRTYAPAWLDLAGLSVEARALRDLRRIVDLVSAQAAGPVVRQSAEEAAAAWAATGAAIGAAARDTAWTAAWDAVRAVPGDAARAAARAAARDAAWTAAWTAAGDAAGAALAPTVATLQDSAIDLLDTMIAPTADPEQAS